MDLENAGGGGYDVNWIVAGEWLEYTISVPETGYYTFIPHVSTVPGFGNFTLSLDNVDVSGRRDVPSTGGWQFWTPIRVEDVRLAAGTHIMRFDFDSDSDLTGWLFSLNYIDVERATPLRRGRRAGARRLRRGAELPQPLQPQHHHRVPGGGRGPGEPGGLRCAGTAGTPAGPGDHAGRPPRRDLGRP